MNDRVLVAAMVAHIEKNLVEPVTVEALAVRAGYSVNQFRRKFFSVTGETPRAYIRKRRLTEAAKEILAGRRITDTALKYGYSSQDNFTTAFRSYFGVTPGEIAAIDDKYKRFITNMREAFSIMEISGLTQTGHAATLMGSVEGAARFFEHAYSSAMLYGLSGHAFVINIHDELCPSGPYVWNTERFFALLAELGIAVTGEFAVTRDTSEGDRRAIEDEIKRRLDAGELCIIGYLEYQLIGGYDDTGFTVLRPWNGQAPSEIESIAFTTWEPCLKNEGWVYLTTVAKRRPTVDARSATQNAIVFARDLRRSPEEFAMPGYHVGDAAYAAWLTAVQNGHGASHGHWWNATVWAECRRHAASFFRECKEFARDEHALHLCEELAHVYTKIADSLSAVSDREIGEDVKTKLLTEAREAENVAERMIEELSGVL